MNTNLDSEYIPIAALNHYSYCPHRYWRMFCAGEFVDNQYTIEGTSLHERVHTTGETTKDDTWQIRAIWLKSERYQLIGKADLIEASNGQFYPVEYKRGNKADWSNDQLQLCAQALCLEEMTGKNIDRGYLYYAHSHQRKSVEISPALRQEAITTIAQIRKIYTTEKIPQAIYSKRCRGCSLYHRCLPQAKDKVRRYQE